MPFSEEWEEQFSEGKHFSEYPWSSLVSLVMRFAHPESLSHKPKVLELGCGVGANIPLFIDKGFEYYAVDGSQTAVNYVNKKFKENILVICHDFTKNIPFKNDYFDLIVDRSATTHNRSNDIRRVITEIRRCLKKNSLFIASDWFSTDNYGFYKGEKLEPHTVNNCKKGYLAGLGIVHFFDEDELRDLFSGWEFLCLMKKISQSHKVNGKSFEINKDLIEATWDLVVKNKK